MSRLARRANSASVQASLGGMFSSRSLRKIRGSIRFVEAGSVQATVSPARGMVTLATDTRPPNRTITAASPTPSSVVTLPCSSAVARSAALDWYWARRVTSTFEPSE